jgi:predicted phosphodiesterase
MPDLHVAVLSDIHGNRWALEAVLKDIRHRGIHDMVNLGDCLYGPLDPAGTAGILLELGMPTVRGNEDRILFEDQLQHPDSPSLPFVQASLRPEHIRWLRALPLTIAFQEIFFLCHGSPERDNEYLAREVTPTACRLLPPAAIALKLAQIAQPVVLFGHDHLPALLRLPDGRLLVNPGSVGLPAYREDLPFPHAMEAGSHHARYGIVTRAPAGFAVEHVAVAYDWRSAAAAAMENGRPDWAFALRSGFAASARGGTAEEK